MTNNKILLTGLLSIYLWAAECPKKFIEIDKGCYYKKHLDVLQDFIDVNESLRNLEPQNIGTQEWQDGKLIYLYLGDHLLTTLPDSIGLLSNLHYLDLRKNQLMTLPDEICSLYPYHTEINLTDNNICPPYPYCFDFISQQNTTSCETFKCRDEYIEIEGECYREEHIQVLQTIIENNESLNGLKPLNLGWEVGYQYWENGKLIILNLMSNELTRLPEDVCSIYPELKSFDVSNNFICPPYPSCFDYIGRQNTQNCNIIDEDGKSTKMDNITDNRKISSILINISNIDSVYFQNDLDILQKFIDKNESLEGKYPLEIGQQKWENMRLISLDLSNSQLTHIPTEICSITENLKKFDLGNNSICPPYPECIEYVDNQETSLCSHYTCPEKYIEIEGECYFEKHIEILQDIIQKNSILKGLKPLDIAQKIGHQKWISGRLNQLILSGNQLTYIPESICDVIFQLSAFDISNNFICPPYPVCIENAGYQNTQDCGPSLSCPEGYVVFNEQCYFFDDLQVLIDFTILNPNIEDYQPLMLGYQIWKNTRLQTLYLDGLEISAVPESIQNLEYLENLNLSNNKLTELPETLCKIYPNLIWVDLENNSLCPPHMNCFDYIGQQNTENCQHDFCPLGYMEIDEECYHKKDLAVLQDFIDKNVSLSERDPLEIGVQKWENMRLDFLYLGVNELTAIPESICEIYTNLSAINISRNKICPPYPACITEIVIEQDTSSCP